MVLGPAQTPGGGGAGPNTKWKRSANFAGVIACEGCSCYHTRPFGLGGRAASAAPGRPSQAAGDQHVTKGGDVSRVEDERVPQGDGLRAVVGDEVGAAGRLPGWGSRTVCWTGVCRRKGGEGWAGCAARRKNFLNKTKNFHQPSPP